MTLYKPGAFISAGWKRNSSAPPPFSLAVNSWLSPVADSGPRGANWSDLWPLTLMEGVAGGQACKGYPLYPSPRTAAQSWGRHPVRIRRSLGPPTTTHHHHIHMVNMSQRANTLVLPGPVMLWPALSIFNFPKGGFELSFVWKNELKADIAYKKHTQLYNICHRWQIWVGY